MTSCITTTPSCHAWHEGVVIASKSSERLEVGHQVGLLLRAEAEAEDCHVMIDDIVERRGAAVVKVGPLQLRRMIEAAQRRRAIQLGSTPLRIRDALPHL